MNEKCSLDNLSRYLRVIGLLSLIIILIIVVYYYLQSNHSSILEKYESYNLRECKVYFTEGETNIKNCDITQETSNYTGLCNYRFDGWSEFDTYTDKDGKIITYPKKVYTETQTNTKDFNNPMFTNNCFKPYTDETCLSTTSDENCIPPEFEYNANSVVKYDEQGTSGNTAVGTNIYGGLRYSSMQFLNTADPRYNNTNLISSICDVAPTAALNSLNNKIFYMFEFNGITNKLENIRSVSLDSNQTTFSPVLSDSVLTKLPPLITENSFGIQYDATNRNLPIKIFKKNNIPRNIAVFKFNYMSYICKNSQIKNYMIAKRIITPEKFIKYGSSTTPNYSKNISVSNDMTIKKDWNWSDYSSADFNVDYSDMLKTDLTTSINERKRDIKLSYKEKEDIAEAEYDTAKEVFDAASQSRTDFATNNSTFSSLIGKRNATSTSSIFDYKKGYNTSIIDNLNFSIPQGTNVSKVGMDMCIVFPYNANNNINGQTPYTINVSGRGVICDILMIGGGGGGGAIDGGGGGAGACIVALNQSFAAGNYTINVGNGGIGGIFSSVADVAIRQSANGGNTTITNSSGTEIYRAVGGGKAGSFDNPNTAYNASAAASDFIGKTGGCGGGGGNALSTNASAGGGVSSLNIVNGITGISPVVTTTYGVYGNAGGNSVAWSGVYANTNAAGGGGIGSPGSNSVISRSGAGGNGLAQVTINSTTYNFKTYFAPNWDGFGVISGGLLYIGGGGGGGGYAVYQARISGGLGGGGIGDYAGNNSTFADAPGDGVANTGSGGGGACGNRGANGGNGGSGIVIIRIKINNDNAISPFKTLDTTINTFYSNEPSNTSIITIDEASIQSKILTSFVFLQKGYYYFKADINGGGYHSSMMIYSDLLLFDEANTDASKRPPTYNARIVYKNNNDNFKVFNKRIYIPNSKFYKLAYRYTICNTTTNRISANFVLDCNYRAVEPVVLNPDEYVNLNSNVNNALGNYISLNNISFNGSLIDYLFCGVNLNNNYTNNQVIMSSLSNIKYTSNNKDSYANIITYLDSINFFNIAYLQKDMNAKKDYMDIVLPAIIVAEYGTDENIKNINKFITIISELKSNRVNVNYGSHLPTTIPSIYKDITIDEIFGKNYERLITKDKVKDDNTLFNANLNIRAPLKKKIYVEAVA
jgi:hypothetical protein